MARHRFRRRRQRDYPLPTRGMRYAELADVLARRDIQHAVRGEELLASGHGLYTPPRQSVAHQHLATLEALCLGTPLIVSHRTAASIWGILGEELARPFHLTAPPGGSRVKRPGLVISHRCQVLEEDHLELNGLHITSPARTWVDVSLSGSVLEALIYADRCRRRGRLEYGEDSRPLASGPELEAALLRRGRPRGILRARRALELSRDGVDSPQETRLRFYMHEAGLPEPEVNDWLLDDCGRRVVQPDMVLRRWRLAIQYDGEDYHSGEQMRKDVRRTELTEALGWKEVRITKDHMYDRGRPAIAKIERELRARGWTR